MQTQNRLLDDLAKLAGGAVGMASGVRNEFEALLRDQIERLLGRMDLVTREEFDAVQAMAAKAREEQEVLNERLAALEAKLAETSVSPEPKPRARKPRKSAGTSAKKAPPKTGT